MNRIIGIMSYRCNDSSFNDFPPTFYDEALLFSQRKVARKYQLLNRVYSFVAKAIDKDYSKYLELKIHSFTKETLVMINDQEYKRVDNLFLYKEEVLEINPGLKESIPVITEKNYELYFGTQNYLFNYSPRTEEDNVSLFYTADITVDDYDDESVLPIIPASYDEEVIKYGLLYICEPAIARFQGVKKEKYLSIYKLNSSKTEPYEFGEQETYPQLKIFKVI
jgi:hypothetical protein